MNILLARLRHEIAAQKQLLQRYVELQDYAKVSQQYSFIQGLQQALNIAEAVMEERVK